MGLNPTFTASCAYFSFRDGSESGQVSRINMLEIAHCKSHSVGRSSGPRWSVPGDALPVRTILSSAGCFGLPGYRGEKFNRV
jgi:hypothetical protein